MTQDLQAAVAAGALAAEATYRPLLEAIADVARAILGARASTIMLLDEAAGELVFEAVTGEGEHLLGWRVSASEGIAGWVAQSRQPLVVEDLSQDPRFDAEAARRTGYVPEGLLAVPLVHEDVVLGVLEVLDRPQRSRFSLAEMDLLELFAAQAAIALHLLLQARRTRAVLEDGGDDLGAVAHLAAAVDGLEGSRRAAALRMLRELAVVIGAPGEASL
jgi:GAF domain-containing protein